MGFKFKQKKITKIGGSHYISIPPEWLRYHKLKAGDKITPLLTSSKGMQWEIDNETKKT